MCMYSAVMSRLDDRESKADEEFVMMKLYTECVGIQGKIL